MGLENHQTINRRPCGLEKMSETVISRMLRPVPFLVRKSLSGVPMLMWKNERHKNWIVSVLCSCLFLCLSTKAQGHTVVDISTAAPAGIEKKFIEATTTQFQASVFVNPLASNTYAIKLFGPNPAYQAPAPPPTTFEQALSLGATLYVYGFANGMTYQERAAEGSVAFKGNLCNTATNFMLIQSGTDTWDQGTCSDVISTVLTDLFKLSLSTPTPIPAVP